jgi:hypothetical protein
VSRADEITQRWAEARPKFADAFHPDSYEITRMVSMPDGSGGSTTELVVVESGRCSLDVAGRLGVEDVRGSVVTATSAYTAELPYESTVTEADTLTINGRPFSIVDVKRAGESGMFTTCELEERA